MARGVLLGVAGLLIGGGVLLEAPGAGGRGISLVVTGIVLAIGVVFERAVYKPDVSAPPGAGWIDTGERSTENGTVIAVWFNPATGERRYHRHAGANE